VSARHLTTAVTLLVLLGLLGVGLLLGIRSLTAPVPSEHKASSGSSCNATAVRKGQRITTRQVQVSVFNAGSRAGLADETMAVFVKRGFKKGEIGNAPSGVSVKKAQVWTTRRHDASARLVALQLGRKVKVHFKDLDLGPGIDVVVGDKFGKLAKATRSVTAKATASVCAKAS
jgi:LytR cell envelope-related transcriptional attenuator